MFVPPRFLSGARLLGLVCGLSVAQAARAADEPPVFTGKLSLGRYDRPRGLSDGYAPTRQLAVRKEGTDAIDWPDFTLNGQPIFRERADEARPLKLRKDAEAKSPFQMESDDVIQPGNHWLRAMEWIRGRRHIYTADKTARCANADADFTGHYELWTFPIRLEGQGAPSVKNVVLKAAGQVVFTKPGPWRSLTLLLPASEPGQPYELMIDGRGPVKFETGLQPVKLGSPRELVIPVEASLGSDNAKITVTNATRNVEFSHAKEWAADLAGLTNPLPALPASPPESTALARYLGVQVPRSPLLIYAAALPHGMSGGFFGQSVRGFKGKPEEYAALLAEQGFDAVFDQANALPMPDNAASFEHRAAALARHGVLLGLQYDNNWHRPSLQHPNLAFFAHTLPEWHAPLYRSLQLTAQRFARWPNFLGIDIGADNAGYATFWPWAPPIPDRPWGEAMIEFAGTPQPKVPRAPSLGAREFSFERAVKTQGEFLKFVDRYDISFRQYGYFAEAVREIDPQLVFTTASFGSAPGNGGRGGWPWASLPGRVMFEGMAVQQAYDWSELHATKPLHNVALVDRLTSYHPQKKTWALLDNFQFLFGREAFQRACALALTRGIQGLGTNFLANAERPEVIAFQKEMHAWMHRFGGVYARTQPTPVIGIFYGHQQAVQRRVLGGDDPKPDELHAGSHEGKVTEALFLCHAAGWPARVITYQEIRRGPLPASMKAILLVGLERVDETSSWALGLEPRLQEFLARGGRILADDESFCPVPSTPTGLSVAAYVTQSNVDPMPRLFARNAGNIARLRAALADVSPPIAVSENPRLWAIPAECGTTQYVTAINQDFAEGEEATELLRPVDPKATKPEIWKTKANASLYVKPQRGALKWNTERPIYDVRLGRKVTREEATEVDLTADAFRWYALPAAEVARPAVTVAVGVSGFYEAKPTMTNGVELTGIPVEITVQGATVFGATGQVVRLPINQWKDAGEFTITVTELLTRLQTSVKIQAAIPRVEPVAASAVRLRETSVLAKFAARKHVPLIIALTPEQTKDAALTGHAKTLAAFYEKQGRPVTIGSAAPGGGVTSLQPLKTPHRYPQWQTVAADLVLFGAPTNNVLLLDQARAQLFPRDFSPPAGSAAEIVYTRSPFVGEYDAVNILASDAAGVGAAVRALAEVK